MYGKLRNPAQGNHPIITERAVVKQVLDMRRGKMHVFHFLHGLYIPALPGDVGILLLAGNRLRRNQAPAAVVHGNAAQIPLVGLV